MNTSQELLAKNLLLASEYQPRSIFTKHSQEHSLSFSPKLVNLNVTQLLTGLTIWFSQSKVVLHSNAASYRKI